MGEGQARNDHIPILSCEYIRSVETAAFYVLPRVRFRKTGRRTGLATVSRERRTHRQKYPLLLLGQRGRPAHRYRNDGAHYVAVGEKSMETRCWDQAHMAERVVGGRMDMEQDMEQREVENNAPVD